jgi:hypothetical protein
VVMESRGGENYQMVGMWLWGIEGEGKPLGVHMYLCVLGRQRRVPMNK